MSFIPTIASGMICNKLCTCMYMYTHVHVHVHVDVHVHALKIECKKIFKSTVFNPPFLSQVTLVCGCVVVCVLCVYMHVYVPCVL